MSEKHRRHANTSCAVCSKAVYRRPAALKLSGGRSFCSQACYGLASRKEIPCVVCSTPILSGLHKKTCGRSCANTLRAGMRYKLVGRPRKDRVQYQRGLKLRLLEQRGHACERCGYNKIEILQVHHKDRDRTHNTLDNLELICANCHAEEHYLKNSWLNGKV